MFREIDRPSSELVKRIQLGGVLAQFGDRKGAQRQLAAATELAEKLDDKAHLADAQRTLGQYLHEWGKRDEGWTRLGAALKLEEELDLAEGKAATLDAMGHAALSEKRFDEAAEMLEGSLSSTKAGVNAQTLLTQCRLASACRGKGDEDAARQHAETAEVMLAKIERVSPEHGRRSTTGCRSWPATRRSASGT